MPRKRAFQRCRDSNAFGRGRAIDLSTFGTGLRWHCRRIATVVQSLTSHVRPALTMLDSNLSCSRSYTPV